MLSWLFPNTCELCGKTGSSTLCAECRAALPRIPRPICLYCGAGIPGAWQYPHHCPQCARKPRPFSFARQLLSRNEQSMHLVHALKYHQARHLARPLAEMLLSLWEETPQLRDLSSPALVPIPIAHERLFRRGYNQSEELAVFLGKALGIPMLHPLLRCPTEAESQTYLNARERQKNAYKAYRLKPAYAQGKRSLPENIILLDDVFTTGSTIRACAHQLRRVPGVRTIGVVTLLRADK